MVLSEQEIKDLRDIRSGLKEMAYENLSHIRADNLQCACGVSAYITFVYFTQTGRKPRFMYQEDNNNITHCWIEIDKYIVDLTATQFGVTDEIFIIEKRKVLKFTNVRDIYENGSPHTEKNEIKPLFETWYDQQNPFYLIKKSDKLKEIVKKINIKKYV